MPYVSALNVTVETLNTSKIVLLLSSSLSATVERLLAEHVALCDIWILAINVGVRFFNGTSPIRLLPILMDRTFIPCSYHTIIVWCVNTRPDCYPQRGGFQVYLNHERYEATTLNKDPLWIHWEFKRRLFFCQGWVAVLKRTPVRLNYVDNSTLCDWCDQSTWSDPEAGSTLLRSANTTGLRRIRYGRYLFIVLEGWTRSFERVPGPRR